MSVIPKKIEYHHNYIEKEQQLDSKNITTTQKKNGIIFYLSLEKFQFKSKYWITMQNWIDKNANENSSF